MTTDYRSLCVELLAAVQLYTRLNPAAADMPSNKIVGRLMDAMAATATALSQPEPVGPTDEELKVAYWEAFVEAAPCGADESWLAGLRAVARLSHPIPQPIPVKSVAPTQRQIIMLADELDARDLAGSVRLVQEALRRWGHHTPQPIPVSKRLPGPKDCNAHGECWYWEQGPESWELISPPENHYVFDGWTHWLPHWALPIPQ